MGIDGTAVSPLQVAWRQATIRVLSRFADTVDYSIAGIKVR